MKKILTLLGSFSLTATAAISVISCTTPTNFSTVQQEFLNITSQITNNKFHDANEVEQKFTTELKKWVTETNDENIKFTDNITINDLGEPKTTDALVISKVETKSIFNEDGEVLPDQINAKITYFYVDKNKNNGNLSWQTGNMVKKITFVKDKEKPASEIVFKGWVK